MPDSSPPPAPSPATTPASFTDSTRLDEIEWFGCMTGDCPHTTQAECDVAILGVVRSVIVERDYARMVAREQAVAPSASPAPAPASALDANTLESYHHIARRLIEARDAVPFDAFRYSIAVGAYTQAFGEDRDGPSRVAQLVAAARDAARIIEAAREYLRCDDVGGNTPAPERAMDTQRARTALREALAARASRPTEEADA